MKNTTGTTHVLAIGVSKYDHSGFGSLSSPTKDAQLITSSLTGPVESKTLLDLTHTQIRQAIGNFAGHLGEEDTFIALYAGHGTDTPFYALTGTDSDPDKEDTLIPMSEFVQIFNDCRARAGLVLLNCCRSGGAFDSVDLKMKGFNTKTNRALVVASRPLEPANEPDGQNHSIFMGAFFHVFGNPNRSSINFSEGIAQVKEEARKRAMLWGVKQQAWSIDQSTSLHIPTLNISAVRLEKAHQSLNFMPNPDPGFVGRENMLTELTQAYFNPDTTIASVTGVGGAGKSSLATQWYQQLEERGIKPEKIFWWGFYENPSLDEALHRLLKYLLPEDKQIEKDMTPDEKIEVIAQHLSQKEYVVVLDGLEVIQHQRDKAQQQARSEGTKAPDLLGEFLRKLARGPKKGLSIVTSRVDLHELTGLETAHVPYSMGKLSLDDTTELFEKEDIIRNTPEELEDVWKQFDGHALSMRLLTTLLKEYYDCHISALKDMPAITSKAMDEDYSTENRTIDAGKVRRILEWYEHLLQPEEKRFLLIFSMFNTPVSQQDFSQFFQKADERLKNQELSKLRPPQFRKIVNKLIKLRLITQQETEEHPQYITHPLIKEYFSGSHSEQETQSTHQALLEYFREKPDGSEQDNAERDRQIIHYAFACGDHHSAISAGNRLFPYLRETLAYAEALALAERFLQELHEEDQSLDDKGYLQLIDWIGLFFNELGNYSQAIACFNIGLERCKHTYGENHGSVTLNFICLGIAYQELREEEKAIKYFQQALATDEQIYEIDDKDIAISLMHLGTAYQVFGKNEKAIKCYQDALDKFKDDYDNNPHVTIILNALGNSYMKLGKPKEAIQNFTKALAITKNIYKKPHVNIAITFSNLGAAYEKLKEPKEAIKHLEQASTIIKQLYKKPHPLAAIVYNSLGETYLKLKKTKEAIQNFTKALVIIKEVYKKPHPTTVMILNSIGNAYEELGETKKAIEFYEQALDTNKKIYEKPHPYIAFSHSKLQTAYRTIGRMNESFIHAEQTLTINKQIYRDDHQEVINSLDRLGKACVNLGKMNEAAIYFERSLAIHKQINEDSYLETSNKLGVLGAIYSKLGEHKKSIKCFKKGLITFKKVEKETDPRFIAFLKSIGSIYKDLKEIEKAIEFYEEALSILTKNFGIDHPSTQLVCNVLADLKSENSEEN